MTVESIIRAPLSIPDKMVLVRARISTSAPGRFSWKISSGFIKTPPSSTPQRAPRRSGTCPGSDSSDFLDTRGGHAVKAILLQFLARAGHDVPLFGAFIELRAGDAIFLTFSHQSHPIISTRKPRASELRSANSSPALPTIRIGPTKSTPRKVQL